MMQIMNCLTDRTVASNSLETKMNILKAGVDKCSAAVKRIAERFNDWKALAEELSVLTAAESGKRGRTRVFLKK